MSIRSVTARVPRTTNTLHHSIQFPVAAMARLGGTRRSVGGTSMPKPDTPPNKGTNIPIVIAAVAAVAGTTYFVTRSSKQHGENIVHDAEKKNPQQVQKVGEPTQPGGLAGEITQQEMTSSIRQGLKTDAPKTAYQSEEKGNSPAKGGSAAV